MSAARGFSNEFKVAFSGWARRTQRRRLVRGALTGLTVGLLCGGPATALLWWLSIGPARLLTPLFGVVGLFAGVLINHLSKPSSTELGLALDSRFAASETITTALEIEARTDSASALEEVVLEQALGHLSTAESSAASARAWPRVVLRRHAGVLVGAGVILTFNALALPPPDPTEPAKPGLESIRSGSPAGLERIKRLVDIPAATPAQKAEFKQLAERAERLREQLRKGLEKRDALAQIAGLSDALREQQLNLGNAENRAGLHAAVDALNQHAALRAAARALGDSNLVEFDQQMQKLANQAEQRSRGLAKHALEQALAAARAHSAKDLERLLKEQQRLFEQREEATRTLREFARALGDHLGEHGQRALDQLEQTGDPKALQDLNEALNDALETLTDDEREALAKALAESGHGSASPMDVEQLRQMAEQLKTEAGRQALKEMLRQMAEQALSGEAERQRALNEAERGLGELRQQLGVPVPQAATGGGQSQKNSGASGNDSASNDSTGTGENGAAANHQGETAPVDGTGLKARADSRIDSRGRFLETSRGRAPARAGETANQQGTGALGQARAGEVSAVERAQIPEEYRQQVGRYFSP